MLSESGGQDMLGRRGAAPAAAADPGERGRLERLLLLTVNGVAAGLQNTG